MATHYTLGEERSLLRTVRAGEVASCPRCRDVMTLADVPPKEGVPYVRHRLWLRCGTCERSLVVDRRPDP